MYLRDTIDGVLFPQFVYKKYKRKEVMHMKKEKTGGFGNRFFDYADRYTYFNSSHFKR